MLNLDVLYHARSGVLMRQLDSFTDDSMPSYPESTPFGMSVATSLQYSQQIAMFCFTLRRQRTGRRRNGDNHGVVQDTVAPCDKACTEEPRCIGLLDLPEALIVSILRHLPTQSKCQAELVCKCFRQLLSDPAPGYFVWDHVSLEDEIFQKPSVQELNRQAFTLLPCFDLGEQPQQDTSDYLVAHALPQWNQEFALYFYYAQDSIDPFHLQGVWAKIGLAIESGSQLA